MFEDQTFDVIMERMLEQVDSSLDKREGSIIYDALAPAAAEIRTLYLSLDALLDEFNISTATEGYLKQYGEDFSIEPEEATCAVIIGEFSPSGADIGNKTFSLDGINYIAADQPEQLSFDVGEDEESSGSVRYSLTAQTAGSAGNISTGTLIPVDNIEGLQTATVAGLSIAGEDEEDTESFRERLLDRVKNSAFGGNVAYYKQVVSEIDGVGAVRVFPCTKAETKEVTDTDSGITSTSTNYSEAAGCVTIAVFDSEGKTPTTELIDTINDKLLGDGNGYGLAPIGHNVYVVAPRVAEISFDIYAYFSGDDTIGKDFSSDTQSTITAAVESTIGAYFSSFIDKWTAGTSPYSNVSVQKIISAILNVDDVEEIWELHATVDDGKSETLYSRFDSGACKATLELDDYDFPRLSSVTIHFGAYPS